MIFPTSDERLEEARDWARVAAEVSAMQEWFERLVPPEGSIYEGVYKTINEFYTEANKLAGIMLGFAVQLDDADKNRANACCDNENGCDI